jgi:hypothetical protein
VTGKIEQNTNFVFTPDDHTFVDAFNTPWQYSNISVSMYPSSTSKNPVLFLKQDTITVVPGVYKTSNYSKRQVFWKGGGSQHFIGGFSNQTNITNKFDALNLFGAQNINVLKLQSADTVTIASSMVGLEINSQMTAAVENSKIDIGVLKALSNLVYYDDNVVVDSTIMLYFLIDDRGMPQDSSTAYYAMYHKDEGFRAKDRNYFIYSEYGDNYLNGELEVTGGIKQAQISAALTDNTPTDAEIDAATGTTPAAVGAGWSVTILDTSGTELLYRVESDGTNWQYQVLTIAL